MSNTSPASMDTDTDTDNAAGGSAGAGAGTQKVDMPAATPAATPSDAGAWWDFAELSAAVDRVRPGLWGKFLKPFRAEILGTTGKGVVNDPHSKAGRKHLQKSKPAAKTAKPSMPAALAALLPSWVAGSAKPNARGFAAVAGSVAAGGDGGGSAAVLTAELATEMAELFVAESTRAAGASCIVAGTESLAADVAAALHRLLGEHGACDTVLQLKAAAHAHGMAVAGRALQPPRFELMDWAPGQQFTMLDDPDRTSLPWRQPSFITQQDPAAQSKRTTVTELTPELKGLPWTAADAATYGKGPGGFAGKGPASFARVVHNVLTPEQCAELLESVNAKGFTPALLNIGRGNQMLAPHARDGHRAIVDSTSVAGWLLEVLKPHIPGELDGEAASELNERCRFLCYTPGQEFGGHCDGAYSRPRGHARQGDVSKVTVQLYLHDVPAAHGGATTFNPVGGGGWGRVASSGAVPCQPVAGSCLLFTQDLYHEGSKVHKGIKYTMRTEVMYGEPSLL